MFKVTPPYLTNMGDNGKKVNFPNSSSIFIFIVVVLHSIVSRTETLNFAEVTCNYSHPYIYRAVILNSHPYSLEGISVARNRCNGVMAGCFEA